MHLHMSFSEPWSRVLIMRYRRDKQRILDDLKLLDQLLAGYEKH
jgi:hypothetical protein